MAPHNDALVVTATVVNYDVARIFIDNGSSVNILFKITLDQMNVEGFEFEPISTPLYGFVGHVIPSLGQIVLPLYLGHEPRRVTKMITFTVVDTPSAYNGILGRTALKDFIAVESAYHQKLKFPIGNGVGVLCGNQKVARRCYEGIVKEEGKRARKKRHFGPEKDKVLKKEVRELLEAGHIRKMQFPTWLLNVVLVPKNSRKWRIWTPIFVHVGCLSGVPPNPLAVEDQDKMSFITSEGTFCYVVMLFGLKNAGATYQRLMDRVFSKQAGRNVEVYVDDIMVKSRDSTQLIPDLVETFSTLRSYGLKLNPQKCFFGVRGGKFLGYMVTERGIEANPEKFRAIQEMVPPRWPNDENEDPWKVYVDGSAAKDGSGVGVVLISPTGEEVKLAVRLDFRASNNETEYEAVLAGLRAARNVGATWVLIFSDSQLVAQKMKGIYDVKDEKLIEYSQEVDRVKEIHRDYVRTDSQERK
ncbi:uncharacterized protein LOC142505021 [Primulina tabacum]|uniref:uncharacterized protein LOC142505021 n=1 Tax=Primulina tabacum TaxID=48773 RepID=UPI003F59A5AB